jgi:hypothetical protein
MCFAEVHVVDICVSEICTVEIHVVEICEILPYLYSQSCKSKNSDSKLQLISNDKVKDRTLSKIDPFPLHFYQKAMC